MRLVRWFGRLVVLALGVVVAGNVVAPAVARAQFVAAGGASAAQVLAALVGQDVTVSKITATAATGEIAFQANEGAKVCVGATDAICLKRDTTLQILSTSGAFAIGANQNFHADANYPQLDQPFAFRGSRGFRHTCIAAASLATCGSSTAPEGAEVTICGASTVDTRKCLCKSDGEASPAYYWRSDTGALGTSTTCPP